MIKKVPIVILFLLPIAVGLLFFYYLLPAVASSYQGQPDSFMRFLIDIFYPRFYVEKERFPLSFFTNKATQVFIRFTFIYVLVIVFYLLYRYYKSFQLFVSSKMEIFTNHKNISVLRILFFLYTIYILVLLTQDLFLLSSIQVFYKPYFWLKIFHVPFPPSTIIVSMSALGILSSLLVVINYRAIVFAIISFLVFFLFQSWAFSFEKLEHGFATYTYAFILLPFLLQEAANTTSSIKTWVLPLIKLSIAAVYTISALEKIFVSGSLWFMAEHLQTYLYLHPTIFSDFIRQYDWLCAALSSCIILFQLSFIGIFLFPTFKWWWLAGGILFHTATLVVMNIGHPLNPWVVVYIFFIDWTRVYDKVVGAFKNTKRFSAH